MQITKATFLYKKLTFWFTRKFSDEDSGIAAFFAVGF